MTQDPLIGRVVDSRYEVVDRVARGGMATVYRANDRRLDRVVALKVMHPHLAESSDFVSRFRREARAAARLSNPGVVAVYDQGSLDGVAYLVMEYVEGPTLRNLVEAGPLSVQEALSLTVQVLRPLGAAHRAGLVHRDIKPENVLLPADGTVAKVADFGLARAVTETTQTTTGNVLGTVAYLAPELITAGDSSPRADVFSVGVMLYEMLTGEQPFRGETPIHIAFRNVHEDVPAPSALVPGLCPQVDALVAALTSREQPERPQDADSAAALLRRAQESLEPAQLAVRRTGGQVPPEGYGADLVGRARAALELNSPAPSAQAASTPPERGSEPVAPIAEDVSPVGQRTVSLPVGSIGPAGTTRLDTSLARHNTTVLRTKDPAAGTGAVTATATATQAAADAAPPRAGSPSRRTVLVAAVLGVVGGTGAGATWYLTLGPGRRVSVPDVTGLAVAEAEARVKDSELRWARAEDVFSDTVAAGVVVSTTPSPGQRVSPGSELTVVVSRGIEQVVVPELPGHSKDEAAKLLDDARLRLGAVTEEYSAQVEAGRIVSCTPRSGSSVNHSSAVAVVVSKGPRPATVPDVVGKTRAEAEAALKEAGLVLGQVVEVSSDTVESGKVVSSTPAAATEVLEGDPVDLSVSKGQQLVTVPDVTYLDQKTAKETLEQAGLVVQVRKVHRPFFVFRDVEGTDPAAGSSVKQGSTVTLKVYS